MTPETEKHLATRDDRWIAAVGSCTGTKLFIRKSAIILAKQTDTEKDIELHLEDGSTAVIPGSLADFFDTYLKSTFSPQEEGPGAELLD